MPGINGSVGRGGTNRREDVLVVQRLLNRHDLSPLKPLQIDGIVGPATIGAIEHFQDKVVHMSRPDGRVDPGGRTIRQLRSETGENPQSPTPAVPPAKGNLSGAAWWRANQQRYPNSRRIDDLADDFRDNVRRFIDALTAANARVAVSSTRRNATRAHLMHYCWKVANGEIDPSAVPARPGLDIQWDHGTPGPSRRAARDMVNLFNMAHIASLTSNHIRGTAIDMTINWSGDLEIAVPGQASPTLIREGPRNGAQNRALHDVGRQYGVIKLVSDPPHWSHNGH